MFAIATVLTDGGGKIPRQIRFIESILKHPYQFLRALWVPGQAVRTSVILAMQSSENYLHLEYRKRWWLLNGWSMNSEIPTNGDRIPAYIPVANEITRRMADKMNGYPKGSWFEVLFDAPTTAHILGGCIMAESKDKGVVDMKGNVFGYPNLYVADGSVVPVNLNANPSLTITALAEYILSHIPQKE